MAEISINAETAKIYGTSFESRHLDFRRRTSDFGDFNGLLGSAYAQEKSWDS